MYERPHYSSKRPCAKNHAGSTNKGRRGDQMSIAGLLERGIRSVLIEPESEIELRALLGARATDPDSAEHVRQTIEAMPGLLVSIERALAAPEAPAHARELFLVLLSYVLDDENLIPSHVGKPPARAARRRVHA